MKSLSTILYVGGRDDTGNLMVITDDPCECGWPERITYIDSEGNPVRSGCAGCEAERPVEEPSISGEAS